jgi:ketosteroid isomerase-like protein
VAADDVELVRRALQALGQGDYQTILAALDPQVRLRPLMQDGVTMNPDMESEYVGPDGFMQFMGILNAAWDDLTYVTDDVRDAGDGRVVALARLVAQGKESGVPVEQPMAIVATVQDGRVVALDTYSDRQEALERVGLA